VAADVNTAAVIFQYFLPWAVEFTALSLWEGIADYAATAAAVLQAAALLACTSECLRLLGATQLWCLWLNHRRRSSDIILCHLDVCLLPCS